MSLIHGLQDQLFQLNEASRVEGNDDATAARMALLYGDALGTFLDAGLSARGQSFTQVRNLDAGLRSGIEAELGEMPETLKELALFSPVYGFRFMQFFRRWKSWDEANELYASSPESSEQIMHPEKYVSLKDPPTEVAIQPPPESLSPPWRRLSTNVLGEFVFYVVLNHFIAEQKAEWSVQGWDGDRYELYEHPNRNLALVIRSVWDNNKDATEFATAYSELIEKKYPGAKMDFSAIPSETGKELRWIAGSDHIVVRVRETQVDIIEIDQP